MKKIVSFITAVLLVQIVSAQIFYTKNGYITFYSHTSIEDIKAENFEAVSFIDATKGELRFQVLIKGFQFPKATMQQHFNNASYMDSDKFPKSEFKGNIINLNAVNFKKDGIYNIDVTGDLTMHGVTKKITQKGTITIKAGKPSVNAVFKVKRSDFNITTPGFTAAKIADEIEVTVKCDYTPYNQ
ncbi:MAG: YceI family protein [Bacteroidota bacterium]